MLCKWCQIKVARNCVKANGGCVPMNALPCDFEGHCDVQDYSKRIIEIFHPESSKREDVEGPSPIPDKGWPDKNAGFP